MQRYCISACLYSTYASTLANSLPLSNSRGAHKISTKNSEYNVYPFQLSIYFIKTLFIQSPQVHISFYSSFDYSFCNYYFIAPFLVTQRDSDMNPYTRLKLSQLFLFGVLDLSSNASQNFNALNLMNLIAFHVSYCDTINVCYTAMIGLKKNCWYVRGTFGA